MAEQLPLLQEGSKPKQSLPIYRVTLVREGQMPYDQQRIRSSADASHMLATYLADVDREHFVVLLLDQKNQVIGIHTVSMGSLTAQYRASARSLQGGHSRQCCRDYLRPQPPKR